MQHAVRNGEFMTYQARADSCNVLSQTWSF